MAINVDASLRQLSSILKQIQEQVALANLANQEVNGRQQKFQLLQKTRENIQTSIARLNGEFVSLLLDVSQVLEKPDHSAALEKRERWRRRLEQIENNYCDLHFKGYQEAF